MDIWRAALFEHDKDPDRDGGLINLKHCYIHGKASHRLNTYCDIALRIVCKHELTHTACIREIASPRKTHRKFQQPYGAVSKHPRAEQTSSNITCIPGDRIRRSPQGKFRWMRNRFPGSVQSSVELSRKQCRLPWLRSIVLVQVLGDVTSWSHTENRAL